MFLLPLLLTDPQLRCVLLCSGVDIFSIVTLSDTAGPNGGASKKSLTILRVRNLLNG
jgi:hypothetical protein